MMVADLFAKLGLRIEKRDFDVGNKLIEGVRGQLAGLIAISGALAAGKESLDFSKGLTDLDIASQGAVGSVDEFRGKILEVSDVTGVAKEELLRGASAFVALTGDGKAANAALETFGKVAAATGANMDDVSGAAAAMTQNLKVDAADYEKAFSILIKGGKAGAVELKDLSGHLASLSPLAAQFAQGTGVEGLAKLGAAFQIARRGFGSAAETATGLKALMGSIVQNAARFEKAGIKVFDKDAATGAKTLKSIDDIMTSIGESKLVDDPSKLVAAFGSSEAYATFLQLSKTRGEWEQMTQATLSANDVAEDFAKRQRSDSAKVLKAWNTVRNGLERVFGHVVRGLAWLTDNIGLVTVAVGSLLAAVLILKAGMIGSAIASAAAWIAASLPLVLIAAGVAALILIIEDLWRAFTGGKSVFKDLYLAAKEWIKDKILPILDEVEDAVAGFLFGEFGVQRARQNRDAARFTQENKREHQAKVKAADESLSVQERIEKRQRQLQRLQRVRQTQPAGTIDEAKLRETEGKIQAEINDLMRTAGPRPTPAAGGDTTITNSVTVNAPGGNADEIAEKTKGAMSEFWDSKMREAAAGATP